jgi:hypothetical protein
LVLEAVSPASLEIALEVFEELRARRAEIHRLHRVQVQRAREEVEQPGTALERKTRRTLKTEDEYARAVKAEDPDLQPIGARAYSFAGL